MNIAYDAFAMGEWNDYSDRREISHGLADTPAEELTELLRRSVDAAGTCSVYGVDHQLPEIDPDVHAQLLIDLVGQWVEADPRTADSQDPPPAAAEPPG